MSKIWAAEQQNSIIRPCAYVDENRKTGAQVLTQKQKNMKAKLIAPIACAHGSIVPGYYTRMMYGKQIVQRCPRRNRPPTAKQISARAKFAENMSGNKWRDHESGNRMVTEW